VILRVVTLLLTGQLLGEVVSEISDYVPVLVKNHSGGQLRKNGEFKGKLEGFNTRRPENTGESGRTTNTEANRGRMGPNDAEDLAAPPKVTIRGNTASVVFPGVGGGGDVGSVTFWNVNGLRARWAARELGKV
jgi:hypothetical protein